MSVDYGPVDAEALVISNLGLASSMARRRCPQYLRDDAAQEGIIKMWQVAKYYNSDKGSFSTYACTVINNKVMDVAKFEKRRAQHFISFNPFQHEQEYAYEVTPLDDIINKEEHALYEQLHRAVESLPLRERYVITVRYGLFEEKPHQLNQIGKILHVSVSEVRRIERHACKKLKELMKQAG